MTALKNLVAVHRKAIAASLPLALEIVGNFVGVGTPWYVKAASLAGIIAVYVAPKNADPASA